MPHFLKLLFSNNFSKQNFPVRLKPLPSITPPFILPELNLFSSLACLN